MKKFLRTIFPFFNKDRHDFLLKKWWFRLLIVLYVIFISIVFANSFDDNFNYIKICQDSAIEIYFDRPEMRSAELARCETMAYQALFPSVSLALLYVIIIHYLSQLIFLIVIVDFIALGKYKLSK